MRVVYAMENALATADAPTARAVVRRWAGERVSAAWPQPLPVRGHLSGPGGEVNWGRIGSQSGDAFACAVQWPDRDDPSVRWQLASWVWNETHGGAGVAVRLGVVATSNDVAGPVRFDAATPSLVASLAGLVSCCDADRRIDSHPIPATQDLDRLACDPNRRLPLVLVGSELHGQPNVDEIAAALVGAAHVATADDPRLPAVPAGCARILWAGWDPASESKHATYYGAHALSAGATQTLTRTIAAASAFRIPEPPFIARLEREARRVERAGFEQQLADLADKDPKAWFAAFETELVAADHARDELAGERARSSALRDAEADARAQVTWWEESFDRAVDAAVERRSRTDDVATDTTVTNLAEALEAARNLEHIVVTGDAANDAAHFTFARPAEVLADLTELNLIAKRWADNDLGEPFHFAARTAGLPWRTAISTTAAGVNRHCYTTTVDGVTVDLGPHLAYGSSGGAGDAVMRIYLRLDDTTNNVIVGRLMRHGRDTKSG